MSVFKDVQRLFKRKNNQIELFSTKRVSARLQLCSCCRDYQGGGLKFDSGVGAGADGLSVVVTCLVGEERKYDEVCRKCALMSIENEQNLRTKYLFQSLPVEETL